MPDVSAQTELLIRELAHGALIIFDIGVILVLLNYLWGKRTYSWKTSPGVQIAFAIMIFVSAQLMRSAMFWVEYANKSAGGFEYNPTLGTIALTIAPFLVLLGLSRIIWTITAMKWRWPIMILILILSVAVPLAAHFWVFNPPP
jgi:hypothetical protein